MCYQIYKKLSSPFIVTQSISFAEDTEVNLIR